MTQERPAIAPGRVLAEMLRARGWTQSDLALILGKPQRSISEIVTGKKAITPETAHALALVFDKDPEYWISLEGRYRLNKASLPDKGIKDRAAMFSLAPIKEMTKRGWINSAQTPGELTEELRGFFTTDRLSEIPEICTHTKKTGRTEPLTNEQRAWCFRARNLAKNIRDVAFYTDESLSVGVNKLRAIAAWPQEVRRIPKILADLGIRLVIVEPLAKTRIDGAAFWLDEVSPVIALSLRYDRIDSFWHSLGHELSHIKHRDDSAFDAKMVGDDRLTPVELDATERRADAEAASLLIDEDVLDDFISRVGPIYSRSRINQFANKLNIHPGIIVGQLQHRAELGFKDMRSTLVKVREFITSKATTDGWRRRVSS